MTDPSRQVLLQKRLVLIVSEPWDFATDEGDVRFDVIIEDIGPTDVNAGQSESLLLRLSATIAWRGQYISYLVATRRGGHAIAGQILTGTPVECNLIAVSSERAASSSRFYFHDWRGGLAAIGILQP